MTPKGRFTIPWVVHEKGWVIAAIALIAQIYAGLLGSIEGAL